MSKYEHHLTGAQEKAKAKLEEALKQCARAKLDIYGMNNSLVCYNGHHLEINEKTDSHTQHGVIPYEGISDSNSYKDSGADDPWHYCEEPSNAPC